ncbi:MAG: AAA family ATPase [Porphyromonas sp.]|nr:AAA family ATPase [Porphyromonas sp.]
MIQAFIRAHNQLISAPPGSVHRAVLDKIDPKARLVCIRGTRGIGKTTCLLDYARKQEAQMDIKSLYVNMNHFYFAEYPVYELAHDFYKIGGRLLLVDQVFKYPMWKTDLLKCLDDFPELRIVFTASSVMTIEEDHPDLKGLIKVYDLKGFSLREYLNYKHNLNLQPITLDEMLENHPRIAADIVNTINPLPEMEGYLKRGYYPPMGNSLSFEENLVKNLNILLEVDIVYIRQIEPAYLHKLRELFFLTASEEQQAINISSLSNEIGTSRATVMNYLKYLADADMIRLLYKEGNEYPRKPYQITPHNTSISSVLPPTTPTAEILQRVYFLTQVEGAGYDVKIAKNATNDDFVIDAKYSLRLSYQALRRASDEDMINVVPDQTIGRDKHIPLWLFGFLY